MSAQHGKKSGRGGSEECSVSWPALWRSGTVNRLALAQVGVVRGGQDASTVAPEQPLQVAVVDVGKEHLAHVCERNVQSW